MNRTMLRWASCIIIYLFTLSLYAQGPCRYVLSGIVYDSALHTPLAYASIEAEAQNISVSGDADGKFELDHLCAGKYELHVSHLNCEHRHFDILITKDTFIQIFLPHYTHMLEGGGVSAVRSGIISRLPVQQMQLSKGATVSELMAGISGVSLMKTGSSVTKPVINGLQGNRVVILNNGIRQEGQQWGAEHAPEIDPFLANQVELLRGPEALRYGSDGIGGTILINPESVFVFKPRQLKGEYNMAGASNGRMGLISMHMGSRLSEKLPLYWRIQGTLKQSGNIKAPHYYVDNTGYRETNYSATLGYDSKHVRTELFYSSFNTHIGIFTGSHVGNLTDLQRAFERDTPYIVRGFTYDIANPRQQVTHRLLKSKSEIYLDARNSLLITYALQHNHRQEYDIKRNPNNPYPDFDYTISTHTLDIAWEQSKFHGWQYTAGLNGIYQRNAYEGRFFIPGFYNRGIAAYGLSKYSFRRWTFEAGLRFDMRNLTAYYYRNNVLLSPAYLYAHPSASLAVTFRPKRNMVHQFILSQSWRAPGANELYSNGLHMSVAAIEVGDSSLRPETAYAASYNGNLAWGKLSMEAELYYKYIARFINLVPSQPPQLTVRGAFPVFRYVQSDAALSGINLLFKYKISSHISIQERFNILWGTDITHNTYLNQMPPLRSMFTVTYTHKDWFCNLNLLAVMKQYRYTSGSDYVQPPSGYILPGIDAGNTFYVKKQQIKLSFSVSNILNVSYRDYLNRFRYYTDEQGRNITIRLTVPFKLNNLN